MFVIFVILTVMTAFSSEPVLAVAREPSSCEKCHTNDAVLKTLYKPPKVEAGAAVEEGEG
jgi:hypothetical protein